MSKPEPAKPLSERMTTMLERSSKLWAESLDRSVDSAGKRLKPDPLNAVPALSKVAATPVIVV